jgi:hypothetical protein
VKITNGRGLILFETQGAADKFFDCFDGGKIDGQKVELAMAPKQNKKLDGDHHRPSKYRPPMRRRSRSRSPPRRYENGSRRDYRGDRNAHPYRQLEKATHSSTLPRRSRSRSPPRRYENGSRRDYRGDRNAHPYRQLEKATHSSTLPHSRDRSSNAGDYTDRKENISHSKAYSDGMKRTLGCTYPKEGNSADYRHSKDNRSAYPDLKDRVLGSEKKPDCEARISDSSGYKVSRASLHPERTELVLQSDQSRDCKDTISNLLIHPDRQANIAGSSNFKDSSVNQDCKERSLDSEKYINRKTDRNGLISDSAVPQKVNGVADIPNKGPEIHPDRLLLIREDESGAKKFRRSYRMAGKD